METPCITPRRSTPTGRRKRVSPSGDKPVIEMASVIRRLKTLNHEPAFTCIRILKNGECDKESKARSNAGGKAWELASKAINLYHNCVDKSVWDPNIKKIMQFLHCEDHWKQKWHQETAKNFWAPLKEDVKNEFITAAVTFMEWYREFPPEGRSDTCRKCNDLRPASPFAAVSDAMADRPISSGSPPVDRAAHSHIEPRDRRPQSEVTPQHEQSNISVQESSQERRQDLPDSLTRARPPLPPLTHCMPGDFGVDPTVSVALASSASESPTVAPGTPKSADAAPCLEAGDKFSNATAPAPRSLSDSALASRRKSQEAAVIDRNVVTEMTKPVKKSNENSLESCVYIFRHKIKTEDFTTRLLKIGFADDPEQRKEEDVSCHELEVVYNSKLIPYARRAERLAHKELENFRRGYECGKNHGTHSGKTEWFEVSEEVAKRVVGRWVKFVKRKPYGDDGELTPFWTYCLGKAETPEMSSKMEDRAYDHNERCKRWDAFVSSPEWYFNLCRRWRWLWRYRSQLVSEIFGLWLMVSGIFFAWQLGWTAMSCIRLVFGHFVFCGFLFDLAWQGAFGPGSQSQVQKRAKKVRARFGASSSVK